MATKNAWNVQPMNLAGIALFEDEFAIIPSGDYEVQIVDSEAWPREGQQTSVLFNVKVSEAGEHQGKQQSIWLGIDASKEGNRRSWKALLVSCGADASKLEGTIQPTPEMFVGRKAYIHVELPPAAEGGAVDTKKINRNFISPAAYTRRKQERAQAPVQSQGFAATGAAPGLPGAGAAVNFGAPTTPQPAATPNGTAKTPGAALFG